MKSIRKSNLNKKQRGRNLIKKKLTTLHKQLESKNKNNLEKK